MAFFRTMFTKCSEFTLREDIVDRERRYSEFYIRIINDYFQKEQTFISGVNDVLESGIVLPSFQLVRNPEYQQCAYMLQYGVRDTCFVEQRFYESVVDCPAILNILIYKGRINICCLGSQTIFAVVGLCKVIEESVLQFGFLDAVPTQIQVFMIDKNEKWKNLCEYVTKSANNEYSKLKLKLDFLVEDLAENFSDQVKLRMKKAHVLTMVKYLSSIPSVKTVTRIIKNILKNMKKNAVLFHVDYESGGHHLTVKNSILENTSFTEIKTSKVPEKYTLHDQTKNSLIDLCHCRYSSNSNANTQSIKFSISIKNPAVKLKTIEKTAVSEEKTPSRKYRARSSNTLRNSTEKFFLVGKFATVDMEKKNKDDSYRQRAKEKAVSKYASFEDLCLDF